MVSVLPIHKHPKYLLECCHLINAEWKRSETARLRSLESSCDTLPVSLVLVKDGKVIGHAKLSPIPSIKDACFVESVVISETLRGQGFGRYLMEKAEEYCVRNLGLQWVYLSTKGQEEFYRKLGYTECEPISIYGGAPLNRFQEKLHLNNTDRCRSSHILNSVPKPPPLPNKINNVPDGNFIKPKTYMFKSLNI